MRRLQSHQPRLPTRRSKPHRRYSRLPPGRRYMIPTPNLLVEAKLIHPPRTGAKRDCVPGRSDQGVPGRPASDGRTQSYTLHRFSLYYVTFTGTVRRRRNMTDDWHGQVTSVSSTWSQFRYVSSMFQHGHWSSTLQRPTGKPDNIPRKNTALSRGTVGKKTCKVAQDYHIQP